jgi:predicted phosphodiesterase
MSFRSPTLVHPQLADLVPGHVFMGVLFIGDPHVFSGTPGRRLDPCFHATVCRKLSHAARICRERNLYPIILGDLLHKQDDEDARMLVLLARALREFPVPPLTIVGNHDKKGQELTDANPLLYLGETAQIRLLNEAGFQGRLRLHGLDGKTHIVAIGGTPYGAMLPTDLVRAFGAQRHNDIAKTLGADSTLWLTHEDLAFDGAYPGALPLFELAGVDMVVNGHMHGTKKPVKQGRTTWYNPGNITRLALDMADHVPTVWEWSPSLDAGMPSSTGETVPGLVGHVLDHQTPDRVFDFTGTHAAEALRTSANQGGEISSQFVAELLSDTRERRTDEAVFLREIMRPMLSASKAPDSAKLRLVHLLEQAQTRLTHH